MSSRSCLNCGAALTGPFCAECGQKDLDLQRPYWALAEDFVEAAFNLESRFWRTLGLMLVAPGVVARRYLEGKRTRYITPAKLYVLVTIVFFVVLKLSGIGLVVVTAEPGGGAGMVMVGEGGTENAGPPRMVSSGFHLAAFVPLEQARALARDMARVSVGDEQAAAAVGASADKEAVAQARILLNRMNDLTENPERTNEVLETWLPRLLILLVPLFALLLKAVFLRRRVLLYDHLVFSLYIHAYFFLLLTILIVLAGVFPQLTNHFPFAWTFLAVATLVLGLSLHQTYGGKIRPMATRFAACLAGYIVIFMAALNGLLFYGLADT